MSRKERFVHYIAIITLVANLFAPIFALEDVFAQEPSPEATVEQTTEPVVTEAPVETETQVVTEAPVVTAPPVETVVPSETENPVETVVPSVTETQVATQPTDAPTETPAKTFVVPNPLPFGGVDVCVDANTIINSTLYSEPNVAYSFADPDPSTDGDLVLLAKVINGAEWDPNGNLANWLPLGFHQFLNPNGEATFRIYSANGVNEKLYQPCVVPTEVPQPTAELMVSVTVNVNVADGRSLEGAPWELFADIASAQPASGAVAHGTVGANNAIVIENVLPGDYRLVISPEGQPALSTEITITPDATPVIDITLDPVEACVAALSGAQEDTDGDGIANACDPEDDRETSLETKVRALDADGAEVTEVVWGDPLTFEITIKNTGDVPVSNITIDTQLENLAKPECKVSLDGILAPDQSIVCTANFTFPEDGSFDRIDLTVEAKGLVVRDQPAPVARRTNMAARAAAEEETVVAPTANVGILVASGAFTVASGGAVSPDGGPYADAVTVYPAVNGFEPNHPSNIRSCVINSTGGSWSSSNPPVWQGGTWAGALGPQDNDGSTYPDGKAPSIGWGGVMVVEFTDNRLVPNGNSTADLWVMERGAVAEGAKIEISADGSTWITVGNLSNGSNGYAQPFNIDGLSIPGGGTVTSSMNFRFVRITDVGNSRLYDPCDNGGTPRNYSGADIDAVWALSSIQHPAHVNIVVQECKNGVATNPSVTLPASGNGVTYSYLNGTPSMTPGTQFTIVAKITNDKVWPTTLSDGWVRTSSTEARFTHTFAANPCTPTSMPTITPVPATCTGSVAGNSSVTVQTSGDGITSSVSPASAPGNVNQNFVVTLSLAKGYAWPSMVTAANGWTITNNTTTGVSEAKKTITVPATQCAFPDVTVTKTVSPTYAVGVGDTLQFTMEVKNVGTGDATGVTMSDILKPVGLDWQFVGTAPTGCTISNGLLSCDFGTLQPTAQRTVVVKGIILQTTTCGTVTNVADVTATNEAQAQRANNSGSASVSIPCDSNAKIWICHSTGSGTNPYTRNEVPKSQIAGGGGHGADTNDIWPAFEWPIGSDTIFPARGNQALLNEPNCLLPAPIIPTPVQAVCENGVVTRPDITMPSSPFFTYTVTPAGPYSQGQQITIKITTIQNIQLPATFPDSWAGWTRLSNTSAETKITFQSVNCSNATVPTVSVNAAVCQTGVAQPHKLTIPTGTGMTVTSITGTGAAGMSPATIIAGGGWGDYTFPAVNSGQVVVTFTIANDYQWPASFPANTNGTWAKINATTATFTFNLTAKDCAASLEVTKTAQNSVITAGDSAVFTITVTNTHASNTAYGVKLTDIVPTGYVWTPDAPSGVTCTVDVIDGKDTLNCDIGTLAPKAFVKVTLTAPTTINPAACPTLIENTSFSADAENAAKVNGIPASITVKCVPTIPSIPEADVDPFVCEAGATSGANTFKVNEGVGFDTFTVKVDGTTVTATAGSYPLPAENGSHTITVTFKLKPGYAAPAGMTAVDGVYTITRNVTVNSCDAFTPPTFQLTDAVCIAVGQSETTLSINGGTGLVVTGVKLGDVVQSQPVGTSYDIPGGTLVVLTFTLNGDEYAWPVAPETMPDLGLGGAWGTPSGSTVTYTFTTANTKPCLPQPQIKKVVSVEPVEGVSTVLPGESFTWTITAWNDGDYPMSYDVVDTLPAGFARTSALPTSCTQTGQVITCTPVLLPIDSTEAAPAFTLEITGAFKNDGTVCGEQTNVASLRGIGKDGVVVDSSESSVTVNCQPGLSVTKKVRIGDTGDFGDTVAVSTAPTTVQYQVTVANTGNTTLTNVAFEDTLSNANEGLTLVSVTGGTITWETGSTTKGSIGSIPVDGSVVVIYSYIVNQNDLDTATAIQNCAEATKSETVSDTECATVTKNRMPNIAFSKVGNGSVTPGGDMVFTIELTNTGNITISNAVISDVLPTLPSGSWTAAVTDGGAYFTLDSLDDGDNEIGTVTNLPPTKSVEITLTATVPGNLQLPNAQWCAEFTNNASVSGTYVSITAEAFNVDDSDTIQVNCTGVSITKSGEMENDGAKVYAPGDTVTYTVTVSNDGNTTVNGITVTDNVPSTLTNVTVSSAPAELCSVSGNTVTCANVGLDGGDDLVVTITGKVPAVGTITWEQCESDLSNTASMSIAPAGQLARSIGPGEQINSNTVENDIDCGTGLTVEKTAADGVNMTVVAPNDRVDEGDTITYTFMIKNTGDTTLYGVDLTDSLAPNVAFGDQDITNLTILPFAANPANAVTITGVYTITQVDIDALDETGEMEDGFVENCASAAGSTQQQSEVNDVESEVSCVDIDDLAEPGIDAAKTSSPVDGPLYAGDLIDFTITVTNTGNTTQTDVTVNEDVVTGTQLNLTVLVDEATSTFGAVTVTYDATSGVISIAGDIPVGGVVTIPVTYAVTQADLDRGSVENCVETTGDVSEDNDCVEVTELDEPGIDAAKTADPVEGPLYAGDLIDFTITVTNTGNTTQTDVTVNEDVVTGTQLNLTVLVDEATSTFGPVTVTYDATSGVISIAGDIPVDGVVTIPVTYTVTQADLDRGSVENCVETTGDVSEDNDCVEVTELDEPGIDAAKTADPVEGPLNEGDLIDFTITVTNTGNTTQSGVTVNEDVVSGSQLNLTVLVDEATSTFGPVTVTYDATSGVISIAGDIPVDGVVTIPVTYAVTQADLDRGSVENCVETANDGDGENDCVEVTDLGHGDVEIEKSSELMPGEDGRVDAGDVITYTFVVTNTGNTTLNNLVVSDALPGLVWVSDTTIETLAPGESVELTATYAVPQGMIDAGEVENCALVDADGPIVEVEGVELLAEGDAYAADDDCITTEIPAEPGITLIKSSAVTTGDDDNPDVDETITYSFVVTNTGNVTLNNVAIADPMVGLTWTDGNTIASLKPGQSVTLTATYVVVQADVDRGMIQNCADVTSEAPDETAVRDLQSCNTQEIEQDISLAVKQECPGAPEEFAPTVGQEIVYTMTISNDGTVTVHNVEVTTSREGTLDSPFPTTLEPGETVSRKWTVVATQADYDAREITVEITVTGETADGSAAELASMVMMQTQGGDAVSDTIMLTCKMAPLATPVPTAPVTKLPETGNGSMMSATAALWIAATVSMVALGAGALGLRYKDRS